MNSTLASSSARPLRLRLRPDLTFKRQVYQGRDYWVAKDPISLKYYRFEEEEYFLLRLIDGRTSPDQIKRRFDYEYAPQKISMQELYQFIGTLHRSCLLVADEPGQGIALKRRGDQKRRRERRAAWSNVLAFRLKGFDPDDWLTWLNRYTGWFFSWPVFLLVLVAGSIAAGLVFSQFELLAARVPAFHEFFAADNWFWLAMTIALTKICHEFGHGLACKRFGGQCHEMGIMFLVMTPCLYCNVSDAWMLPNKWARAMIAAAGMYVELVLVILATFVWWFSQPGLINQLALNMVVVTSVSTLLFNANPLLRYDGYYILADLLEIPNLRQKASTIFQRTMGDWCLGITAPPDPFLPARHKWLFIIYSVAAVAYRWLITLSIFWFVYRLFEPYGMKILGQLIAGVAVWGLLGAPLVNLYKYFSVPGRWMSVKMHRLAITAGIVGVLLAAILLIPLPHYVHCCFSIQPRDVENVFVDVAGVVTAVHVQPNQYVSVGEPIVELRDVGLEQTIERLRGAVAEAESRYRSALHLAQRDPARAAELAGAEAQWKAARSDLQQRMQDVPLLTVSARRRGVLLTPSHVREPEPDADSLGSWHGTPLEPRNVGAYLEQQTLVARIVPDPRRLEAILAVDQGDIEFVQPDQTVELFVRQLPGTPLRSTTQSISPIRMKAVPPALSSRTGGPLVTTTDASGNDVPQTPTYLVSVPIDCERLMLVDGATGRAKIRVGSQTIGWRIWRAICRTFRFEL